MPTDRAVKLLEEIRRRVEPVLDGGRLDQLWWRTPTGLPSIDWAVVVRAENAGAWLLVETVSTVRNRAVVRELAECEPRLRDEFVIDVKPDRVRCLVGRNIDHIGYAASRRRNETVQQVADALIRLHALAAPALARVAPEGCVFCERAATGDVDDCDEAATVFRDAFPVATGHTLVAPRAHVANLFALDEESLGAVWRKVAVARRRLARELSPDGFTVGVNVGQAAGQTVSHAHVHIIPRFHGDVPDPRGGIRWVVPERAPYWQP